MKKQTNEKRRGAILSVVKDLVQTPREWERLVNKLDDICIQELKRENEETLQYAEARRRKIQRMSKSDMHTGRCLEIMDLLAYLNKIIG